MFHLVPILTGWCLVLGIRCRVRIGGPTHFRYYPTKHPKTGKAMFEATGGARPSLGRERVVNAMSDDGVTGGGAGVFGSEAESDDEDEDTIFGFD